MSAISKILVSNPAASTAGLLVFSGGLLTTTYLVHKTSLDQAKDGTKKSESENFQIETDLMQRIAQKPYLQAFTSNEHHPRGVPQRLRVLAIDVPDMRTSFDGECRLNLSKIYADGIAPPKVLQLSDKNQIRVAQKSLARSLIKCRKQKKIGVELLEASVADLNPHNMRKTHQFGNLLKYDPGKYATRRIQEVRGENDDRKNITEKNEKGEVETVEENHKKSPPAPSGTTVRKDTEEGVVLATEEDELDAPWNQYAWIEEMQLRINGKVPFGSTLDPSSSWSRLIHGNVFKTKVPSNRSWWEWFLPPILHSDPAGKETSGSKRSNWASHRPHAVIADGAAMQRVPGSMRFLQKTCQEANVPLFVVNDPRVWGGNTHQDLDDALRDMRKTIKYRIVQESMKGSAFSRGRLLGQLETEAKWQAKDIGRRTRQAVKDANRRLQQERDDDWSELDVSMLRNKLTHHKVIQSQRMKGQQPTDQISKGMMDLAHECLMISSTGDARTGVKEISGDKGANPDGAPSAIVSAPMSSAKT